MTRAELIKALESLETPTRELADEVLIACGWAVDCEDHEGVIWRAPNGSLIAGDHNPLTSIDSALTLLPVGSYGFAFPWFYNEYSKHEKNCVFWRAAILTPIWEKATPSLAGDYWFERVEMDNDAATPAIALCIAALKAQESTQ